MSHVVFFFFLLNLYFIIIMSYYKSILDGTNFILRDCQYGSNSINILKLGSQIILFDAPITMSQ